MKKKNIQLPEPEAQSQIVALSWSNNKPDKIVPWVNVNGKWVAQTGLPANHSVEICVIDDLLTIKEST